MGDAFTPQMEAERVRIDDMIQAALTEWGNDGRHFHLPPAVMVTALEFAEIYRVRVGATSDDSWETAFASHCYAWFMVGRAFQADPFPITPCPCTHERSDPNAPVDVMTGKRPTVSGD